MNEIIIENVTIGRIVLPPSAAERFGNMLAALGVKTEPLNEPVPNEQSEPESAESVEPSSETILKDEQMELNLNSESKKHPKQAKKRKAAVKRECGLWIEGEEAWETYGNFKLMCEKYKLDYNSLSNHSQMKERDRILKRALSFEKAFREKYPMILWGYYQYDSHGNRIYVDLGLQKIHVNEDFVSEAINS